MSPSLVVGGARIWKIEETQVWEGTARTADFFKRFRGNPRSGKASREARFENLQETREAETSARSTVFGDLKETQEAARQRAKNEHFEEIKETHKSGTHSLLVYW